MAAGVPWNLGDIQCHLRRLKKPIFGVSTPFEFEGSPGSTFPWHVENFESYSVNYLVSGAPKHWFFIPSSHYNVFLRVMKVIGFYYLRIFVH